MESLLGTVVALPLAGFVALALFGSRLPRPAVAAVGAGSVGLSALLAIAVSADLLSAQGPGGAYADVLWHWLSVGGLNADIGLRLDALSVVMVLVVTCVGFLIHLYSTGFMARDPDYARFFAYMNLFVGSMLVLVLADNLLLLYLGWEAVGLCSYLLIGFWYRDAKNARAAIKAFVVTRVGDAALAVGLFVIFTRLGTLNIQGLMAEAQAQWPVGSGIAVAAAALLLAGAVGKSAQLPLQTWLPDAMAGPTPVSALIHAATMVTAGVYLIARTHVLFALAPQVQLLLAIIGAATLLLAAFSATAQTDIKRVLAYSTMSQIGYMFLALGVGAWSAAIFHFFTHAIFKSLLFLAAGAVIIALDEEHSIFKMGALRNKLPIAYWSFLAGAASLAALPLVTAGFYSKDLILDSAWTSPSGSFWLWAAGWLGAVLTGIYIFRVFFVAFAGPAQGEPTRKTSMSMGVPLAVLAVLAIVAGFIEMPRDLGNVTVMSGLLHGALPQTPSGGGAPPLPVLQVLSAVASLGGLLVAWVLFGMRPAWAGADGPIATSVRVLWHEGWGFNHLYDAIFVRPYQWVARANAGDFVDLLFRGIAWLALAANGLVTRTQTGRVRDYAIGVAIGAIAVIAIVVFWP